MSSSQLFRVYIVLKETAIYIYIYIYIYIAVLYIYIYITVLYIYRTHPPHERRVIYLYEIKKIVQRVHGNIYIFRNIYIFI